MRKALSFVLVLSLVLGSFSMAFAADSQRGLTDVAGHANLDAIQVAYDLGIITGNPDGTFQPEKAVNRAEFAAMITRALAIPDSALAGYTSTSFKDTVGYGWAVPYLAFCQSKGIMLGDGAGNAMPGRTITVNEAVTMALRAIGYTQNSALLVGAWPANYVTIAQNEDLYDKVASDTTVNKASAAQIIYNLLTVQKVAVNADGDTEFLWKDRANTVPANLLNTNLGAEEKPDVILGDDFGFSDSLINIVGKLGAFGTAYVNDDDELIAFTVKSTALTGKVDGTKFKVGDTKYDLPTTATGGALFRNGDCETTTTAIDATFISTFATSNAEDGKTVTIYGDVSGKKIKEIYSVVAWKVSAAKLAPSDVQDDIFDDQRLLGKDFVLDDDDEIDLKQFQLLGVNSLSDIEEDDVVYVYADGSDIRKIEVGTETVEGVVEETDGKSPLEKVTIDGTEYKLAPSATSAAKGIDVDSEGIFYLDYAGKIFDFDGTSKSADSFAIVKAGQQEDKFNNMKLKLYLSDDSTKTFYLEDAADDIDWTTTAAMPNIDAATAAAMTPGTLIGYSLNSDGEIDALDVSAVTYASVTFQSIKVLDLPGTTDAAIDSNAVVFTYKNDPAATGDYDVASLSEVKKGAIATAASLAVVMYNDDGKVVALFIDESFVDVDEDDVYGVFNSRSNAKSGDDEVYKFTGFIDGVAFTKKTDTRNNDDFRNPAGAFAVYKITVDANDVITAAEELTDKVVTKTGSEASGYIVRNETIDDLANDNTVIIVGQDRYTIADDAIVYEYDPDDGKFSVADLDDLDEGQTVSLYDTKGDDADGVATIVIFKD